MTTVLDRKGTPFHSRPPGHDLARGSVRFASELIAWVAIVWALSPLSIWLGVAAVVLLIAFPAIFSTPGDRPGGDGPVAVPGIVTILHLVIQLSAAVAAAWIAWPWSIATIVSALCCAVVMTERPRWKALLQNS